MNWHSVDTNEAKSLLRKEIIDREILFEGLRDCFCRDHDPSENVARYFVTLEQAIAGNHVWSLKTPRYMLS